MKAKLIPISILLTAAMIACNGCANEGETQPAAQEPTPVSAATVAEVSETAYPGMEPLDRSDFGYIVSLNNETVPDEANDNIPAFIDVISVKKQIDEESIIVYIELRGLPQTLTVNQSGISTNLYEYSWRINFDTGADGTLADDISVIHGECWSRGAAEEDVALLDEAFADEVVQHQVSTGQTIAGFQVEADGNTLIFRIEKAAADQLRDVHEDTPFHVLTEHNDENGYYYDLIPQKQLNEWPVCRVR